MLEIFSSHHTGVSQLTTYEPDCWINLISPTQEEMDRVREWTDIPQDFLSAALDIEERARIENEDDYTLILVDIPTVELDGTTYVYATLPFAIIDTGKCLITVCTQESSLVTDFKNARVRNASTTKRTRLIFQILHRNSSRFLMYLRQVDKASDSLHAELQKSYRNKELLQMMALEKSLVYFSTSLKSNEVVLEKLVKVNYIRKWPDDTDLLEDVIIENRQAMEMCSIYRDILSGTMDAYASIISNNLNIVMKFMAAVTIIISLPTLVASIWGTNVDVPWRDTPGGFWYMMIIAVCLASAAAVYMWKRKMF